MEDSIIRHYVLRICIYAVQHMDLHFPLALADTPANEDQGQFSPDGRWVAYTSNESGLSEIYVIPFPPTPNGGRWMVSRGGGVQPRWRRDGRELFYISPDWTMMAVPVNSTPVFHAGTPQALFNTGPANAYQSECLGNACGVLEALWQASTRRQLDRHQVTKVELLKPNGALLQSLAHGRYNH